MKKTKLFLLSIFFFLSALNINAKDEAPIVLRYAHQNPPNSVAGTQAKLFADMVNQKSNGRVKIEVYPASLIGSIKDMLAMVSKGQIAIHHNTMAGLGDLYEDFAVFDTPYLYRDVNHLIKTTSPDSELMKKFSEEAKKKSNIRVFYTFYFGTRELTCSKSVKSPDDLKGLKVRSIPFPIYSAAVEGLGAIPTPLDFSETYKALSSGIVIGQENPLDTIFSARLYEVQKYLIMTNHIMGMEAVVFNEGIWNKLPKDIQDILTSVAVEVSKKATQMTLDSEKELLGKLKDLKMIVITPKEGLQIEAFKNKTNAVIKNKFGSKFSGYYDAIAKIQ
jgi:TRAP-type transport system periplasmic protein